MNDKIPNPKNVPSVNAKGVDEVIKLLSKVTVHIHNIQMSTSIAFESRFENFLRKMKQEKHKNPK